MSMICFLRRFTGEDLARLQADPSLLETFLGEDAVEDFGPFAEMDIEKAWHGIHYLLTGSAWEGSPPLNFLVLGGQEIGDDLGYGPARGFSPSEVKTIANALSSVTSDALRSRYDPNEMQRLE